MMTHFVCKCLCEKKFELSSTTWKESRKSMQSQIWEHSKANGCGMSLLDIIAMDVEAYTTDWEHFLPFTMRDQKCPYEDQEMGAQHQTPHRDDRSRSRSPWQTLKWQRSKMSHIENQVRMLAHETSSVKAKIADLTDAMAAVHIELARLGLSLIHI